MLKDKLKSKLSGLRPLVARVKPHLQRLRPLGQRIGVVADRMWVHGKILAKKLQSSQTYKKMTEGPWTVARVRESLWSARYPLLFVGGLIVGDLAIQSLVVFLPKPKVSSRMDAPMVVEEPFLKARPNYEGIVSRNVFCPGCPVPDMKARAFERPKDCNKAAPARGLNLKLVGTIVLSNPAYSVATFSKGSESVAYKKGDSVGSGLSVFEIRSHKVCFVNGNGILSHLELPQDAVSRSFGGASNQSFSASESEGISRKSENEFEIKRSTLAAKIQDPNLLFQAAASPYYENGVIAGFKIDSIVPGSVYETLGIQAEDVITGVNGSPIDSVAKATEIYSSVNTATEISIEIMRGGRKTTQTYKISK